MAADAAQQRGGSPSFVRRQLPIRRHLTRWAYSDQVFYFESVPTAPAEILGGPLIDPASANGTASHIFMVFTGT